MSRDIHISFDLDGTIADSLQTTVKIVNQMIAARGGREISAAAVRPLMGLGGTDLIQQLLGTVAQDPREDIAEFRSIYADWPAEPEILYPGVANTLAVLADRGYTLSLCSNKSLHLCEKILQETGIDQYFPVMLGGNQTHKPDVKHWHALVGYIGTPEIVYYVGDSAVDREFCAVSGMQFIYASYGYGALDSSDGICYTITKFDQLAKMFL